MRRQRLQHIQYGRAMIKMDNKSHYHRRRRRCCDFLQAVFLVVAASSVLLLLIDETARSSTPCQALSSSTITTTRPRGCAATPMDKKKVVVLGVGGCLGSMTFGFLQRSSTLYGTGIAGPTQAAPRAICATGDSATRLNRVLSKQFVLAFADESFIKLTDLKSVDAIQQRLQGYQAMIIGNEMEALQRPATSGSYEKTPNDKVNEVYWPTLAGSVSIKSDEKEAEALERIREQLINNTLQAAKRTGTIQHIVAVVSTRNDYDASFVSRLKDTGIPYTCLHPTGPWARVPDYSYRKGVQTDLQIRAMTSSAAPSSTSAEAVEPIAMEDMAALCVQCLQSLDWSTSRHLRVSCQGPVTADLMQQATSTANAMMRGRRPPKLRPDQEWCVNSMLLERALQAIR
jgi:hypothetical protein